MTHLITLVMPAGPAGEHEVDLDTLTPMARALAEAIAETSMRYVRIRSRRPMREMYAPGVAEWMLGADDPRLDQPMTDRYERWMTGPAQSRLSVAEILEYEARKMTGWYPVAADGTDLPSTPAARDDDGITADQALALLATRRLTRVITKDEWMRKATRGVDGLPAPVRHNGQRSLWSEAAVRQLAERLAVAAR